MSNALSLYLRTRVLAAVWAGASHQEAAERFGVEVASVSRWRSLQIKKGMFVPVPLQVISMLTRQKLTLI